MFQLISFNTIGNPKSFYNEHKCMMHFSCVFPLLKSVHINHIFCGCFVFLYTFLICLYFLRSQYQTNLYRRILDAVHMTQSNCDSELLSDGLCLFLDKAKIIIGNNCACRPRAQFLWDSNIRLLILFLQMLCC